MNSDKKRVQFRAPARLSALSTLVWLGERFLDFRELILHLRAPLDMIKTLISEPKRSATDITNAPHSA